MKRFFSGCLAAAMALTMAACSDSSSSEKTSGSSAAADASKITETSGSAGGSGKLVIYSPNSDTEIDNILAAFQEKYPDIEVELQSMGTGDCVARIEAESENPNADVMWGGMNYGVYKQHPDLWEEYVSVNDGNVDENYKNDTGYFSNYVLSGSGAFIKNDKLLKELGVDVNSYEDLLQPELKGKIAMGDPTASSSAWAELTNFIKNDKLLKELGVDVNSYEDLLQPELKGKIAMGDPTASSSAWAELTNMLLVKGGYDSDEAWDYVQKFIDNLDGKVISSSSQVYKGVIDGEYAVGVSYEDPVVQAIIDNKDNPDVEISMVYPSEGAVWLPAAAAIVKDAPNSDNYEDPVVQAIIDNKDNPDVEISMVYPSEGAVWLPAAAAIVKDAPNSDNAKLFIDYLQSDEAQDIISTLTVRPAKTSLEQKNEEMKPMSEIKVVYEDIPLVAEKKTEWQNKWTDMMTN